MSGFRLGSYNAGCVSVRFGWFYEVSAPKGSVGSERLEDLKRLELLGRLFPHNA
jgi:hypothetical protein